MSVPNKHVSIDLSAIIEALRQLDFVVLDGKRYMKAHQFAAMIHYSVGTLANWRVDGIGPRYHKLGNRVLYEEGDVLAWIAEHRLTSTSDPNATKLGKRRRRRPQWPNPAPIKMQQQDRPCGFSSVCVDRNPTKS